ncbi:MAG TPA: cation diffusion facilitator family transporter [Bryobacteraceae bacterium]|nr:cation diffusion facilitator family transporter [Bryobacteraceae bacterium]
MARSHDHPHYHHHVPGHAHGHDHSHDHSHSGTGRTLVVSVLLTSAFVVVEAFAGFRASSLALLSDAGHNFADAFALLLALFGFYLQSRPANAVKTFGYQRAGVLAAFVNAVSLVVLALLLFYESYHRLMHPQPVVESTMIAVAALGLALNLFIVLKLGGHGHDMNLRAAWIHMLGDALSCVAIIVGAVVIHYSGWLAIDPILSMLIGAMIVWSGWGIIQESINVLLEGLPKGIELEEVSGDMRGIDGVIDVHDLHIWSLGTQSHALSCHVLIDDMPPSASEAILKKIKAVLLDKFAINHSTIQFEHQKCEEPCSMAKKK